MKKEDHLKQIQAFRDALKVYYKEACGPIWGARNGHKPADEDVRKKEKEMREKLTEDWGRLEHLFVKIKAPIHSYHPMVGVTRSIFEDALSFDFEGSTKGQALEGAIQSATKAIGLLDALSDSEYKGIFRSTPNVFVGHSFADEQKDIVAEIIKFVSSFPVSVTTGEKPSLVGAKDGVPEKVRRLIDDADLMIAVLTKDEAQASGEMISSKWVSDEISFAIGKEKIIIRLVERGVQYKPAISGDAEFVSFGKENLAEAFLKLSQLLNSFLSK